MAKWELEWKAPEFPVRVESALTPSPAGGSHKQYRVTVGDAAFAGAVAVLSARDTGRILLVRQERIRLERHLWELPRGMAELADSGPVQTALRELHEETGIRAESGEYLGMIFPDSGFLTSEIAVVRVIIDREDVTLDARDGEIDDQRWFSEGELGRLIAQGELRDAISLAALAVAL
ncbi:MAG: NUDIX hydrolase [Actinomycetaceae bacterium]|nr:NUDIX hydrolase [Actinomycetaceae bacterium]